MSKKVKILDSEKGYNLAAKDYDKNEKYLNSFEKDVLYNILNDVVDKKILDVGAGTGRLAIELFQAGADVTALDVSEEMLKVLNKKNSKIKTVIAESENLPFADESFDFVISAFHIVHLKDPSCFFDEAYRVLKNNGYFLVTNINQRRPPDVKTAEGVIQIESYYHKPEKIREKLEELAFGIEKEEFVYEGEVWVNQVLWCKK